MGLKECIDGVTLFNEIAGNFSNITNDKLIAQSKVVREEGIELLEAVESGVENEILKECVDVLVTIHGFVKMLEEQGYDVMGAWSEVNSNNLSKFPSTDEAVEASLEYYYEQEIAVSATTVPDYNCFVIKNDAGKVVKPLGYKKCNVASYTPKGILPKVKE